MSTYTLFSSKLAALSGAVHRSPSDAIAKLHLGRHLLSAGLRTAALQQLLGAYADGVNLKTVGHLIAQIEFDLGRLEGATSFLETALEKGESGRHLRLYDQLKKLAEASRIADADCFNAVGITKERALLLLTPHLNARRFDRIRQVIGEFNLAVPGFPKAQALARAAELELFRQEDKLNWRDAKELAQIYEERLRLPKMAEMVLADLGTDEIASDDELEDLGARLLRLGDPLSAARFGMSHLARFPNSRSARFLLLSAGRLMDDRELVRSAISQDWLASESIRVLRAASAYYDLRQDDVDASASMLVATSAMLTSMARLPSLDPRRRSLLQIAAFIASDNDPGQILALDSEQLDLVRRLTGSTQVPSMAAEKKLRLRLANTSAGLADIHLPFQITSLIDSCRLTDSVPPAPSGAVDTISLIRPSDGTFRPALPEPVVGEADDGWSHDDLRETIEPFRSIWPGFLALASLDGASL